MRFALTNATVLTNSGLTEGVTVLVDGTTIADIVCDRDRPTTGYDTIDLDGATLAPGFIDTQVNGGGGVMLNDRPTIETLQTMAAAHRRFGTTGMLPTLITTDTATMRAAAEATAAAMEAGVPGILGIHFEGPMLNPKRRGVHDGAKMRPPEPEFIGMIERLGGAKVVVTLAPELVGPEYVKAVAETGAVVSIGHSDADYQQARTAFAAGASAVTHLFNALPPIESRRPGAMVAALHDPNVHCGIIVDGFHVAPATLKMALAANVGAGMILVTDAMSVVGSDRDTFELDGRTIRCEAGRCATSDGVLAGSALDMSGAVRNAISMLGVDVAEALRMASLYPARMLGLDRELGRIKKDYRASLVALDQAYEVMWSMVDGRVFD